jgi:hypothetical protein
MRLTNAETAIARGELPLWLLTLTLPDGRALRMASRPVEVRTTALGSDGPYSFDPFLSGISDFVEELDPFSLDGVGSLTQARVEIATPGVELGSLQGDWMAITASTVELALLWEGQAYEDRFVALEGTLQALELGIEGQATGFTVEATPPSTSETVGDDERDLGVEWAAPLQDTAAADMTDLAGVKYQYVYGDPDSVPAYKIGSVGGNNRLILVGHHLARTGASYQVNVYEDGVLVPSSPYTVTNGTTAGGEPYAYVEDAGGTRVFLATAGAFTWQAAYGGIAAADGVDRPALQAEGIARRLLRDSGLRIDWRRAEPCLARLRDWRLAFWVDTEVTAIDLLRERILAHLPVVEMNSGAGLWWAYCDPHTAPIEFDLTLGQELVGRVGRMTVSDLESVRNAYVMNFEHEAYSDELLSTVRLDDTNSAICLLSQQLYGTRAEDPEDNDNVWDAATGLRILAAKASRLALPRRALVYQAALDAYWLRAGMVGFITDPGYGITQHRAVITSLNRSMFPFEVTFKLIDRTPTARDSQ